jgi:DNA-binding CsgD family transcriptional regulator
MEQSNILTNERKVIAGLLGVVALLAFFDVYEDWEEGASLFHATFEYLIILTSTGIALYLWWKNSLLHEAQVNQLHTALAQAHKDATLWKQRTADLNAGLSQEIEHQLQQWGLSHAEQEVAFLLLKGLSLKEVASVRKASERTVRSQAAAIYTKSRLEGRAQLAAFFLEDLLDRRADK